MIRSTSSGMSGIRKETDRSRLSERSGHLDPEKIASNLPTLRRPNWARACRIETTMNSPGGFCFVCEDVFFTNSEGPIFTGRVEYGVIRVDDRIRFPTAHGIVLARVAKIGKFNEVPESLSEGDEAGIGLKDYDSELWHRLLVSEYGYRSPQPESLRARDKQLGISLPCKLTGPVDDAPG